MRAVGFENRAARPVRIAAAVWAFAGAVFVAHPSLQTPAFVRGTPVNVDVGSRRLFLVDVNRDRRLDLVASLQDRQVGVFLGDGVGRFNPIAEGPVTFDQPVGALGI